MAYTRRGRVQILKKKKTHFKLFSMTMRRHQSTFHSSNPLSPPFASTDGRTAFSVALFSSGNFKCFGPFTNNVNVVYEHVFLNLGDVYNTTTGIFTVPHSGVYSLALTVYSDAGSQGASLVVCANLQVNGIVVSGSTDSNTQDQEDSFTIAVALELNTGDEVAVSLPAGCFLCDDISHYNTFSAFLLYCNE